MAHLWRSNLPWVRSDSELWHLWTRIPTTRQCYCHLNNFTWRVSRCGHCNLEQRSRSWAFLFCDQLGSKLRKKPCIRASGVWWAIAHLMYWKLPWTRCFFVHDRLVLGQPYILICAKNPNSRLCLSAKTRSWSYWTMLRLWSRFFDIQLRDWQVGKFKLEYKFVRWNNDWRLPSYNWHLNIWLRCFHVQKLLLGR